MNTLKLCLENADLNACFNTHHFSTLLTKGRNILKEF